MKYFLCFLVLLVLMTTGFAATVERIPLIAPQPMVFTRNVNLVLNTTSRQSLVVWEKYPGSVARHSVWGRLLLPDGVPTGAAFPIITAPNPQSPNLVYNPDANQFLLVFANETGGPGKFDLYAHRLSATGRRAGKAVKISPPSDGANNLSNTVPRVVYDAETKGYVVVWRRGLITTGNATITEGFYGAVLNADLTVRQAPVLLLPFVKDGTVIKGPSITDLAIHAPSKKLLIAGYTISNDPGFFFQYFAARVIKTLDKGAPVIAKLKSGLSSSAAPHAELTLLSGGQMGSLFVEGTGVKKRRINALGVPLGPVSLFFASPVSSVPLEFPSAAYASNGQVAVVGIDDSSTGVGSLWMQLAAATGTATGAAIQLQSNITITQQPAILPLPLTTPGFYAVVFTEGAILNSPPTAAEFSVPVLLRVNTTQ